MRGPVLQHLSRHFATITAVAVTLCVVPGHTEAPASGGPVVVATYEGVINPVATEYLHDALSEARTLGASALVIKLDTPGGLDTSMRLIIKDIIAATFPVVVYVSPSGGRAASAGAFITLDCAPYPRQADRQPPAVPRAGAAPRPRDDRSDPERRTRHHSCSRPGERPRRGPGPCCRPCGGTLSRRGCTYRYLESAPLRGVSAS